MNLGLTLEFVGTTWQAYNASSFSLSSRNLSLYISYVPSLSRNSLQFQDIIILKHCIAKMHLISSALLLSSLFLSSIVAKPTANEIIVGRGGEDLDDYDDYDDYEEEKRQL